ncbi:hypothetical protein TRFO_08164 [Tritrichomonas foetus]|uniref:DUF3447 domain-containing protein n=1 Tax=Tritrichomonas foetus TaxID=1144522 RepID=A0A1J4JQS1_9EUKA|nr:hypothetical protein TRFO_08164 [Tritrichomonas foetus]|eukprot:OHS99867.1 hypothetical protein TRFO_08164 [Tritrichomonas foetus]
MRKLSNQEAMDDLLHTQEIQFMLSDINHQNLEDIINFIKSSVFIRDKYSLEKLLSTLRVMISIRPLCINLYLQVLLSISDYIARFYTSDDLLLFFSKIFCVIAFLFENGLISIQSIQKKSRYNIQLFKMFYSEIQNNDAKFFNEILFEYPHLKEYLNSIDETLHKMYRIAGMNEDEVASVIRKDDLETFMTMINEQKINFYYEIPHSQYDHVKFINSSHKRPSVLEYSAFFGSVNIFKYIYSHNISLSDTLPRFAVAGANSEIIHLCIEKGQNFSKNCMNVAIQFHRYQVCEFLNMTIRQPFRVKHFMRTLKFYNIHIFLKILPLFIDQPNITDKFGDWTLLHCACNNGNLDMVQFILSLDGIDKNKVVHPEKSDDNSYHMLSGINIMHSSAREGQLNILKYLADIENMPVNSRDNYDNLPVHFAASSGHPHLIRYFIDDRGVDINSKNMFGWTPLYVAVKNRRNEVISTLLKYDGLDINAKNNHGKTALCQVVKWNHIGLCKTFIKNGASVTTTDNEGWTILHYACAFSSLDTIKFLINLPAVDLNVRDINGMTPILVAASEGRRKIVSYLEGVDAIDKKVLDKNGEGVYDKL